MSSNKTPTQGPASRTRSALAGNLVSQGDADNVDRFNMEAMKQSLVELESEGSDSETSRDVKTPTEREGERNRDGDDPEVDGPKDSVEVAGAGLEPDPAHQNKLAGGARFSVEGTHQELTELNIPVQTEGTVDGEAKGKDRASARAEPTPPAEVPAQDPALDSVNTNGHAGLDVTVGGEATGKAQGQTAQISPSAKPSDLSQDDILKWADRELLGMPSPPPARAQTLPKVVKRKAGKRHSLEVADLRKRCLELIGEGRAPIDRVEQWIQMWRFTPEELQQALCSGAALPSAPGNSSFSSAASAVGDETAPTVPPVERRKVGRRWGTPAYTSTVRREPAPVDNTGYEWDSMYHGDVRPRNPAFADGLTLPPTVTERGHRRERDLPKMRD